jgi:hypothetical protein
LAEPVESLPTVGQAVSLPASAKVSGLPRAAPFALRIVPDAADVTRVRVRVTAADAGGLAPFARLGSVPARWEKVFFLAVAREETGASARPVPMVGRYVVERQSITFIPGPALTPGVRYRAVFDPAAAGAVDGRSEAYYAPPAAAPRAAASVTAVYPTQEELPANLLKFYVYFDRPMAEGEAFRHVHLLNDVGTEVAEAFREVELWSGDHRRLTLWVNPGRTKRSLGLSEAMGPVLESRRRYTLVIDAGLPDQRGARLARGYRKAFRTTLPDRVQPDMAHWVLRLPRAGSTAALGVTFPEPMDRALALRTLRVEDADGHPVTGRSRLDDAGKGWSFVPDSAWRPAAHGLAADPALEDLAGNSLERPFETREGEAVLPPPSSSRRFRAFTPVPGQ